MNFSSFFKNTLFRSTAIAGLSLICIMSFSGSVLAVFPHLQDESSRRYWIRAKNPHVPTVRVYEGERYQFSAGSTDYWYNKRIRSNATGYAGNVFDAPVYSQYSMMSMVCEIHNSPNLGLTSFTGFKFRVGTNSTHDISVDGYLFCFANDNALAYGDNSGRIHLRIKRKR